MTRPPDSKQLVRQWAILRLLASSRRSYSVKELADQLGSSKSTIQRDLATLEQEFALVEEAAGAQKKLYRLDESLAGLEGVQLGMLELLALHAASSALAGLAGTPIYRDLQSVQNKIRGQLAERHNGALDAMARVFLPHGRGFVDYGEHQETIDELVDAISRRRMCQATYHAAWKGTTRIHTFRPLRLVWHRAGLYLLCSMDGYTDVTTLAVQRIRALEVLDVEFPPPRTDVAAHARKAFGIFVGEDEEEVEVLFSSEIAWQLEERTFHPEEQKERLDDGRLRYRIRSSAQWEIIPWVLRFGTHAELVSPASWREELKETLISMAATYGPRG